MSIPVQRHPAATRRPATLRASGAGLSAGLCAVLVAAALAGCGGGGGGSVPAGGNAGGAPVTPDAAALAAEIARTFPPVPDRPFEVAYACERLNSRLLYFFYLHRDGSFHVDLELDNHQEVRFGGSYTYAGGALRLVALNNPVLPLDETTTRLVMRLGLVGGFETPSMRCVAMGHGENDPGEAHRQYRCPSIRVGAASDEENALEFVHAAVPFDLPVAGSVFRQRDVWVTGASQPNVTRGYGIYRRVGDRFYADFAGSFDDHDLIRGQFGAGDQTVTVDQLEPQAGPCTLR